MSELVSPKIEDLSNQFDILEKDTHEKSERLFDANRAALYNQSWVEKLSVHIKF